MKLSVVVPCFNGAAFLAQTLQSVLNQTLPADEIIVVDNGSTDDSLAIASAFGGPVTAISSPDHGASAARNAGMAHARGDAIMFLDADDLLGPDTLAALVAVLEAHPGAMACCPWVRYEPVAEGWRVAPPSCAPRRPGQDDLSAWLTGWYHPPCSMLWSRAAYERSGGWDASVIVNNDGDIVMRGLIAGNALIPTEQGTGYYRRLPAEMTSLSGTRRTRVGIESRLGVLDRVASLLDDRGRLPHHAGPLAEAYAAIAPDAARVTRHLGARCRTTAATYREMVSPSDRLASGLARRYAKASAPIRRRISVRPPADPVSRAHRQTGAHGESPYDPLVSVIIPTFNRAATLTRAIDSVLAQDHARLELIVVDDRSTDDTRALLDRRADPRLSALYQATNQGVAAARNRGMRAATGDLIAFLDSDDEWLPGKLAAQVALFGRGPSRLGLVYTGTETVQSDGRTEVHVPVHRGDLHAALLQRNVLHGGGSSVMIRRDVIDMVGVYDTTLPAIEDYDYWVRIARFYDIDLIAEPLVRYYDESDDEATRRSRNFAANMTARRLFFERFGDEMRRMGVDHRFLLDSAQRHLASPKGSRRAAAALVARALARHPLAWRTYPWLPFAMLPRTLGARVQEKIRHLRRSVSRQRSTA